MSVCLSRDWILHSISHFQAFRGSRLSSTVAKERILTRRNKSSYRQSHKAQKFCSHLISYGITIQLCPVAKRYTSLPSSSPHWDQARLFLTSRQYHFIFKDDRARVEASVRFHVFIWLIGSSLLTGSFLRELQSLPSELHWFCEDWTSNDGFPSSSPNVKLEHPLGNDVSLRRSQAADCLTLYSYDDAHAYQEQLGAALDLQLGRCDVCIEEYYRAKLRLVERLRHDYDEDDVRIVEKAFNDRDIERISRGLGNAARILKRLDLAQRHKNALKLSAQLALFEALCNNAFLVDADLLNQHFQEPFTLVQTNKRLNIARYSPAATTFLFDADHERWTWATNTWSRYRVPPTKEEFEYAIREPLLRTMQSVTQSVPDEATLQRTWYGIGLIVDNLDNDLVTHSLLAMEINVFMLALEHLRFGVPGFRYVVETIQKLLELAPKDFWDSMGTISPTTVIEQIFNNEQYDRFMEQSKLSDVHESSALKDMLSWIKPLMASLDTAHQVGVCPSLAFQLLDRLQVDRFPEHSRLECYRTGLAMLAWTLNNVNKEGHVLSSTGRIVATETLEVISQYIGKIARIPSLPENDHIKGPCLELSLRVIKFALALDCKSIKTDHESLKQTKHPKDLPGGYASHAGAIWDAVVQNMDQGNVELAKATLVGINDLMGLEKFRINADEAHSKEKSGYNIKLGRLAHLVCQMLERINEFSGTDLDKLYQSPDSATALVSSLFASDTNLYEAGVNLVKSISGELARREAIGHLLGTFLSTTLNAVSWSVRRISRNKTYASCPRMLKTCSDVLDILCNSQDGLLRIHALNGTIETKAVESFWQYSWEGLKVIYEMTEDWGRNKVDDSNALKEFCRDTMQYSERLFDQYSIFANALETSVPTKKEDTSQEVDDINISMELLKYPANTMEVMVRWLRLRDFFLVEIAVKLTKKVLNRLTELNMTVEESTSKFLEQIIVGGPQGRTHLNPQEKAELARSLEANLGRTILGAPESESEVPSDRGRNASLGVQRMRKKDKPVPIDLEAWKAKAESLGSKPTDVKPPCEVVEVSDEDEFSQGDMLDQEMLSVSRSVEMMKQMKDQQARPLSAQRSLPTHGKKPTEPSKGMESAKTKAKPIQTEAERISFREKREKEKEAKKKRDAENLAMVKRRAGIQTLGESNGLNDLGIKGKDHAPKGPSMMLSSGTESDSEDDIDEELFGKTTKPLKVSDAVREYQVSKIIQAKKAPVKKTRQARSAKDMRARLAPDLKALHREILSWDFFHNGEFPPCSKRDDYSLVSSIFRTHLDYQNTFEPLLTLEAWQSFLKSKEEGNFRAFQIKVANRMNVDAFLEVSTTTPSTEVRDHGLGEADIMLLSKAASPTSNAREPHCLARVWKINRKKATTEVTYRVNVGNSLVDSMVPDSTLHGVKISSITPLEREYGALMGLKYFDLCDEIIRAKPSPLLDYSEKQLNPLIENYKLNLAQAKAVKSAMENDAFTLIQGPPGSGKTKTIVAIVGTILSGSFVSQGQAIMRPQAINVQASRNHALAAKKLLVCAPSNAAVDELVMRFKQGITTANGENQKISVIRLGRSDAINANVMDVTLEELVNAKLNIAVGKKSSSGDDLGNLIKAHKATCEDLNVLRVTVAGLKASGKSVSPEQNRDLEVLKRKKQQLSNQIDQARDSGDTAARDAEINRRRVQQEVLEGAHVICATLSGSGHEMFQNLNIEFETVVIDEAAQSIELSALIPLKYGCSKCILVGDPKQLPPTVLSREAARFQYEQSLFVRMQANHPHDVHLLDTQYRMHPDISVFPSKAFYDGRLLDGSDMARQRARPWHQSKILGPYRFFDVRGFHQTATQGHSLINLAEVDVALKLYHRLITDFKDYEFKGKIGVITPYKSQLRELRSRFAQKYGDIILSTIDFNTTDAFQGRESEIILFSCVRASLNQGIGFLSDIRRMNVGITRAKSSLWVLGNSSSLMRGEFWGQLIEDARSRDCYTSGDLNAILQKPLPSIHTQTPLPNLSPVTSVSTGARDRDVDMPDAPSDSGLLHRASGKSQTSEKTSSEMLAKAQTPSGGKNGLNDKLNCSKCGSSTHTGAQCDNSEAIELNGGQCHRCGELTHFRSECTASRCITCGKFGHVKESCRSTKALTIKQRQIIGRQEIEHKMAREMAPEIQRKQLIGDHDPKVPVVRSTSSTPPLEKDKKRKREASPPGNAPRGPKLVNGSATANVTTRSSQENPHYNQKTHNNKYDARQRKPHDMLSCSNKPSTVTLPAQQRSQPNPTASVVQPPPEQPRKPDLANPQPPTEAQSEIIRTGNRNRADSSLPSRPPFPNPSNVRPPKKKKPVDPFLRPKNKR